MGKNFLRQALQLAQIRRGFCAPNPAVGAVIVKNNEVIATGYHWAAGFPHAEQEAVSKIADRTQGATLYVTLEPCCHWGKTAPCTQAIIKAGIKQVFYGMIDPNPLVSGKAVTQLREAGIHCEQIKLSEVSYFYRSYAHWVNTKLPWVSAKLALSLDGKIAGKDGQPVELTGNELKAYTHQCRKQADALLTTASTLNRDNPQLNARIEGKVYAKPLYILDKLLKLQDKLQIYHSASKLIIFHSKEASRENIDRLSAKGVECRCCDTGDKGLDLPQVIAQIGQDGVHDLWVEAGGECFESLLRDKLAQRVLIYLAPKIIGQAGYGAFEKPIELLQGAKAHYWESRGKDMLCRIEYSD